MPPLEALVFDIQGTAVDFHAPVMRMGAAVNATKQLALDWTRLAARWRALYREHIDTIIEGRQPWTRVDAIYREALDTLLEREGVGARFTADEREAMNAVWTRLDAWPDSVEGLTRLRRRFITSALSNAGMAAVIAVIKHAALPFDAVLTAELARSYKPAPAVYQLSVDYLGVPAERLMMVACHTYDLRAAKAFGMRTAFVARPFELGPAGSPDTTPDPAFDINARDFVDLAEQLGA